MGIIITGGYDTQATVSKYNVDGWVKDLENLNTGRHYHACGSYSTHENELITWLLVGGTRQMCFWHQQKSCQNLDLVGQRLVHCPLQDMVWREFHWLTKSS